MKAEIPRTRFGSRGRPEESRAAILQAAIREFSREGVAGARTDAIARAARVNKALLYYYFKDKEALYGAVLDEVFGGLTATVMNVLSRDLPPRKKILAYAGAHFDYVASHPSYPRIVQSEMMRASRGSGAQLERVANQYFRPLFGKISELLKAGQVTGEFRHVDPLQFFLFHQCTGDAGDDRNRSLGARARGPAARGGAGFHLCCAVPVCRWN